MLKPFVKKWLLTSKSKDSRVPVAVHGDVLTNVAVVAMHNADDFAHSMRYVKELRAQGIKTVDFYIGFSNERNRAAYTPTLKDFPFSPKSFAWNGAFVSPELKQSKTKTYDLVIDLSQGMLFEADVLVFKLKSKWKAGRFSLKRKYLFDFMIESQDEDLRNFIHHMNEYIMKFNIITTK